MSDTMASIILAMPLTLMVIAGWDTARRHYANKGSEAIRLAASYAADLEKRMTAVESRTRAQESALSQAQTSLTEASFNTHQWADHAAKLEQRVAGLEKGQRDIAMRLDAPSKLSRFQRG